MRAIVTIFFLLAGISIAYFLVILGYSGINTSFCGIWLFFAFLFLLMGWFTGRSRHRSDDMPAFLPVFVFTSFGLGVAGFVLIMSMVIMESGKTSDKVPDYCIVMGARVYPDGISRTLMYRLDKACEVYAENPDIRFVVAGGRESGDAVPEALAMYNYMVMKGVPGDRLLIQASETSTAGIIAAALRQIAGDTIRRKTPKGPGDAVWAEDYVPGVGIITSDYHLLRAVSIARKQGVDNPVPISADSDDVLYIHQCVRESCAFVKDLLMGNFSLNEDMISFSGRARSETHPTDPHQPAE